MRLDRVAYFNPFVIDIKEKQYVLEEIKVFEDGKIIANTNHGWFGSSNTFYDGLELPCDCVKKNKVDLNCKTAFIVRGGNDWETRYILYIPNSVVKLGETKYTKTFGSYVAKTISSSVVQGVIFETMKNCCPKYNEVMKSIQSVGEDLSHFFVSSPVSDITRSIEKLEALKDELNELKERFDNTDAKTLYEEGM